MAVKRREEQCCCTSSLICKIGDETEDTFCMLVSKDDSLLYTGHHGKVNLWRCSHVSSQSKTTWTLQKTISTPVKGDVTSVCEVFNEEKLLAIAVDNSIVFYNQQSPDAPVQQVSFNKEEVNQLDVNFQGNSICACDDSGEIKVIDVKSFQVLKTLRCHDNICATVKYVTRKPWELISGGLDCKLIRWDFNRGRPLSVLNQVDIISNSNDKSLSNSAEGGSYSINPPMIHSIDTFPSTSTVICGLGNGMIAAYGLISGKGMDLLCVETFHSTSIACVCCVEVPRREAKFKDQFVVSGGNDGQICVVQFRKEEPSKEPTKPLLKNICQLILATQWNNGSKINWITVQRPSVMEATEHQVLRVFVADQTSSVSVYDCSILC